MSSIVQIDNNDGYYLNITRNNGQIWGIKQLSSGYLEGLIR
ncbi:TPA: hypothetical protein ACIPVM_002545 [Salmonella enterica subsp. diarizonae serovar 50:k:z35]